VGVVVVDDNDGPDTDAVVACSTGFVDDDIVALLAMNIIPCDDEDDQDDEEKDG
jgi:hypothetical protein